MSDYAVAPGLLSVSNGSPLEMLKSIGKLFAAASGEKEGGEMTFHPTEKCPDCGTRLMRATGRDESSRVENEFPLPGKDGDSWNSPLRDQNAGWRCPNLDCPARIRARVEHWCSPSAMDIAGGNAALVAALVGKGLVRDVAELYRLKEREIAALPEMDQDSARTFFEAITASRKRDAWRVLFGLDMPRIGADAAKSLCRHFGSVDNVFAASAARLMTAEDVSEAIARSIVHWHGDSVNRKLVKRLFKAGVNFKSQL